MATNSPPPALLGSQAIDQAFCGMGAGIASTLCMHPLDLLKVRFQIAGSPAALGQPAQGIISSLRLIVQNHGPQGLWRGLSSNIIGNSSSWGLYFLWYSVFKRYMTGDDPNVRLSSGQHLSASASAGVVSALMTNPIWVVRTRIFASSQQRVGPDTRPYKGFVEGLYRIARNEGLPGLYRGSLLAVVGVSNGAVQFMVYERFKLWAKERKLATTLSHAQAESIDLTNTEYLAMSGSAKFVAIALTYPYQVIRSRIQNQETNALIDSKYSSTKLSENARPYSSIPDCISRTFRHEGIRAFYKGLWPNAVRVLPGTCLTFLVYENLSSGFRKLAEQKSQQQNS